MSDGVPESKPFGGYEPMTTVETVPPDVTELRERLYAERGRWGPPEVASNESVRPSGIIISSQANYYGELRAWVKVRGEAPLTLFCTPEQFKTVWQEYRDLDLAGKAGNKVIAACDFNYGIPHYLFRHIVSELVYVGCTHQPKERAKPAAAGIWDSPEYYPETGVWIE